MCGNRHTAHLCRPWRPEIEGWPHRILPPFCELQILGRKWREAKLQVRENALRFGGQVALGLMSAKDIQSWGRESQVLDEVGPPLETGRRGPHSPPTFPREGFYLSLTFHCSMGKDVSPMTGTGTGRSPGFPTPGAKSAGVQGLSSHSDAAPSCVCWTSCL